MNDELKDNPVGPQNKLFQDLKLLIEQGRRQALRYLLILRLCHRWCHN